MWDGNGPLDPAPRPQWMRPFNSREKNMGAKCCIEMDRETNSTSITDPESGKSNKFRFDFSYDSLDSSSPAFCSQQTVWDDIGVDVLKNAYEGYNVSLFAYGQTGSGKSYSMMGYPPTPLNPGSGIIPIACSKIFDRIDANEDSDMTYKVECSMLEIYMEKVKDLFDPTGGSKKVREHPKKGPYVDGLEQALVGTFEEIDKLMEQGTKARTVAATNMNATSSRAHTVFQILLTQTKVDRATMKASDKVSLINLIDLAGSERAASTGASGARLKEGSAINKSLSALGNVISALATNSDPAVKKKKLIPYRDSALTQLLKNSLGGNSKTVMIAAISPADVNYDETLSTLRYADRAKQIKNVAKVNEDPNTKLINQLRSEIEELRAMVGSGGAPAAGVSEEDWKQRESEEMKRMREQLEQAQKLLQDENKTWEEKEADAKNGAAKRAAALQNMGMQVDEKELRSTPHISNLNEDPVMNGKVKYLLRPGVTRVGRDGVEPPQDVKLRGLSVKEQHCVFHNEEGAEAVTVEALGQAEVFRNGEQVPLHQPTPLAHGDRLIIGSSHVYRFNDPVRAGADAELEADETAWEGAMAEKNKKQVEALMQDDESRRQADEEKAEMARKMQELEEAMAKRREEAEKEERERQAKFDEMQKALESRKAEMAQKDEKRQAELEKEQEEARKRWEQEQGEMRKRQEELEEQLQREKRRAEAFAKRKEQEKRDKSVLDEKVMRLIPRVQEANSISKALDKGLAFKAKLVANHKRSVVDEDDLGPVTETLLYVRVEHPDPAVPPAMWEHDKFMDRLYRMQEMYQEFEDNDNSLEGLGYEGEDDPFYDPPEAQLIGTVGLYVESLAYLLNIDGAFPIMGMRGDPDGELVLELVPHLSEAPPPKGQSDEAMELEHETLEELRGQRLRLTLRILGARGIPKPLSANVHVKYRFFYEPDTQETAPAARRSINPELSFEHTHEVVVTDEFLKFAEKGVVEFRVYGQSEYALQAVGAKGGADTPTPAPGGASPAPKREAASATKEEALAERERQLKEREERLFERERALEQQSGEDASVACAVQ